MLQKLIRKLITDLETGSAAYWRFWLIELAHWHHGCGRGDCPRA